VFEVNPARQAGGIFQQSQQDLALLPDNKDIKLNIWRQADLNEV
jgi:hypothetical protein